MKCTWHLCEVELQGRATKFCSINCKNKFYVTQSRRNMKRRLVEHFGGKCIRCGYSKSVAALQFHHHNDDKSFGLSQSGVTRNWEKALEEAKKCELICANCHAEHHANQSPIG